MEMNMSKRSDDWMEEFGHIVEDLDDDVQEMVLKGEIEICPCCNELSAYCWNDTTSYDDLGNIIPGGFEPEKGTIAHIGTCSGLGEWECGHCKRHIVERDSVLNSPCYTHSED